MFYFVNMASQKSITGIKTMYKIDINEDGSIATLTTNAASPAKFHAIWLRDNAWDPKTRAPGNGQRLIALRDIPANTHIGKASITNDKVQLTFEPESKTVEYDIQWLLEHAYDDR